MKRLQIWPSFIGDYSCSGFSDHQLEMLCFDDQSSFRSRTKFRTSFRTSEEYGHGTSFRALTGWPRWLPIPVQSDHGIDIHNELDGRDELGLARTFLVWSEWRKEMSTAKRLERVLNPMVAFRILKDIRQVADAQGTLVFVPHMKPGRSYPEYDWDAYFHRLLALPDMYHPLTICLSRTEVQQGLHRVLRKYGLPIVSVGLATSPSFGARFYDIVSRFRFATSSAIGSQLWYCEELGVRYFLLGESPYGPGEKDSKPWFSGQLARYQELFSEVPPSHNAEKDKALEAALYLSQDPRDARKILQRIFWRDFPLVVLRAFIRSWRKNQ